MRPLSGLTANMARGAGSREFHRQAAGSYETWYHPTTHTTIPNHPGEMPEGILRAILKQAGIEPEVLLKK